jgi:DNA repair exonuclease SbcCD nuclease subunit
MIEEVVCRIPVVFVTGNHEHKSADDWLLYTSSFKLYNLDTHLTTGFQFGDLYILPFDPYLFVN